MRNKFEHTPQDAPRKMDKWERMELEYRYIKEEKIGTPSRSTSRPTTARLLNLSRDGKPGNKTQIGENTDSSCKGNGNRTQHKGL